MKRILFVEDEPSIRMALQWMVRPMQAEWETRFAEDAAAGLLVLEQWPAEVVVSDFSMPGLDGADFLQEVMRRYPRTVRLILSGYAPEGAMVRCVGVIHQFLLKPCSPAILKQTIARIDRLASSVRNESLMRMLNRLTHLPTPPRLYVELSELLQSPETGLEDIAAAVERNPDLTSRVLKLVNSGFFGLGQPVSNLLQALGYVGMEVLKGLVLALQTFHPYTLHHPPGINVEEVWQHSVRVAGLAREIARLESGPADAAFVAGLLHDIGKLVFALNCPEEYLAATRLTGELSLPLVEAEEKVFGCHHADLAGYLLGLWGLPPEVVEAIALHHDLEIVEERTEFTALTAVHVANACANAQPEAIASGQVPGLNLGYLRQLGVLDRLEDWIALTASHA
ncbi:MAG: HDOD domain-containing protein [Limisphaerales bacterium]